MEQSKFDSLAGGRKDEVDVSARAENTLGVNVYFVGKERSRYADF